MPFACAAISLILQSDIDPNRLPIGPKGEATVPVGQVYDLNRQRRATVLDIVDAAKGKRFVYLGENHGTTPDQQMEAEVIAALVGAGRHVVVGMEMYQRPKQDWLDQWSAGTISEPDFLEKSDWKGQWGFDFAFYRPVFQVVRDNGLPLIGLNVPRTWVHAVATGGFDGLTPEAKGDLPANMDLGNKEHRQVWNALIGGSGHPMTGPSMDNMYAAQVLWDEAMSDTAIKYLDKAPKDSKTVFVVIAGSGHVMYKEGINWRVAKRHAGDGITVVMVQSDEPATVSRGLADFVYVTPVQKK
ncbi:MAG TPA: ChaN family lipoprotein [Fimbriimonadaceae bacterium]|nr:ChaN family lipoprotein [Fimbriimonadaceae bacterium]